MASDPGKDQYPNLHDTDMETSLRADSELYQKIIKHQPVVVLTRIKLDKLPPPVTYLTVEDNDFSSSSEDFIKDDSDEDWIEANVIKRSRKKVCTVCLASYQRQTDLDKHTRLCHGESIMPYSCEKCGRRFLKKESVLYHMKKLCKRKKQPTSEKMPTATEIQQLEQKSVPIAPHSYDAGQLSVNMGGGATDRRSGNDPVQVVPLNSNNQKELMSSAGHQRRPGVCGYIAAQKRAPIIQNSKMDPSSASPLAISKIMADLDFSLPAKYRVDEKVSSRCSQCGVVYPTYAAMIRHFRVAHKDAPMPYSCHNCSLGFLDIRGLRTHLAKSKRFCAKMVYTQQKAAHSISAHASGQSAQKKPEICCGEQQKLDSHLREKYNNPHGRTLCPICDTMVTGSMRDHLEQHKKALEQCMKQNRFICDVCLVDSDSIEWMIGHQRQAHGWSLDWNNSEVRPDRGSSAFDKDVQPPHGSPVSRASIPQDMKEIEKTLDSPDKKDFNCDHPQTLDPKSPCLASEPGHPINMAATRLQNVIEIKPLEDPLSLGYPFDVQQPAKALRHNSSQEEGLEIGGRTEEAVQVSPDDGQQPCNEPGQSPGPPVLYPAFSSLASPEESSNDMPNLFKESDACSDDVMIVDDFGPSHRHGVNNITENLVKIKQEKDTSDYDGFPVANPTVPRTRPNKSLSERSFMDALMPAIEPVRTDITSSNHLTDVSDLAKQPIMNGDTNLKKLTAGLPLLDLLQMKDNKNPTEEGDLNSNPNPSTDGIKDTIPKPDSNCPEIKRPWHVDEVRNINGTCHSSAPSYISKEPPTKQLPSSDKVRNIANDVPQHSSPSGWQKEAEKARVNSTESDSGVSEVKLDDDDLQDEVIIIDLDDQSVTTEYLDTTENGTEQSLKPQEHKELIRQRLEDMAAKCKEDHHLGYVGDVIKPDTSNGSATKMKNVTDGTLAAGYNSLEEEKRLVLEKQKQLYEKIQSVLSKASSCFPTAPSTNQQNMDASHLTRMNGHTCQDIGEIRKRKQQHTRPLLTCDKCSKGFPSIGLLNKHKRFAHAGSSNQKLPTSHDAANRQRVATVQPKSRAYPCSRCGEYYPSLALLHEHKKTVHNLTSKYLCLQCDKSFPSRGQLQSHTRWKHTPSKTKHRPEAPSTPLPTKAMLKQVYFPNWEMNAADVTSPNGMRHKQPEPVSHDWLPAKVPSGHNGMQPAGRLRCSFCDVAFLNAEQRTEHEQTSCRAALEETQQNIRYVCDVCGLAYQRPYSLIYHRQKEHPEAPSINVKQLRVELGRAPDRIQP